ncbi:MAG: co-chaperone GroES [Clostridia bacterium]|jgi:chaperonin GroES|nr:co-chaperone GroES [Clostridia bacterium]
MKIKPLFDKVVVQHIESEETTSFGLILTGGTQEKPQIARIIAVGNGGVVDGKEVKMEVKPGQKILYGKYAGSEFKIDGQQYIIIRQNDILAIVED